MSRIWRTELDALRRENEQLGFWLRDAQEKLIVSERMLERAIAFIERQSGATHRSNLHFERSHSQAFSNWFSISHTGEVNFYDSE